MALSPDYINKPAPLPRGTAQLSAEYLYQEGADQLLSPQRQPQPIGDPYDSNHIWGSAQKHMTPPLTSDELLVPISTTEERELMDGDHLVPHLLTDGDFAATDLAPSDVGQRISYPIFSDPEKVHATRQYESSARKTRGHRPTHVPKYIVYSGDRNNKKIAVENDQVVAIKKPDGRWSRTSHENREVFTDQIHAQDIADALKVQIVGEEKIPTDLLNIPEPKKDEQAVSPEEIAADMAERDIFIADLEQQYRDNYGDDDQTTVA